MSVTCVKNHQFRDIYDIVSKNEVFAPIRASIILQNKKNATLTLSKSKEYQ